MRTWPGCIFLACALLASSSAAAPAADANKDKGSVSYSYYLISCGTFVKHRESGPSTDISNTADLFYVAGWVSAYNRLKPGTPIPEDTTLDDIMLWLEQYCGDNPLSNVEAGLYKLSDEVKPRATPAAPAAAPAPASPPQKKRAVPSRTPVDPQPFHTPVEGLKPLPY